MADPENSFDARCNASVSCPVEGHVREIGLGAEGTRLRHVTLTKTLDEPRAVSHG